MSFNDIVTFGGTKVELSETLAETYDLAGFEAVGITWTEVGFLATAPQPDGVEWSDVSFNVVNSGDTQHRKGTKDRPEKSFDLYPADSDDGQALLDVAKESREQYAMKVTYSNGEIHYLHALIYNKNGDGGGNDDMRQQSVTFRVDPQGIVKGEVV